MSEKPTRKELAIDSLVAQIRKMVEESGAAANFDAREWVLEWIEKPLPALDGQKPTDLLISDNGLQVVSNLLERSRAGAYS